MATYDQPRAATIGFGDGLSRFRQVLKRAGLTEEEVRRGRRDQERAQATPLELFVAGDSVAEGAASAVVEPLKLGNLRDAGLLELEGG